MVRGSYTTRPEAARAPFCAALDATVGSTATAESEILLADANLVCEHQSIDGMCCSVLRHLDATGAWRFRYYHTGVLRKEDGRLTSGPAARPRRPP